MKWFVNLLVLGGAGVLGYYAEPSLRLELTGMSPTAPHAPVAQSDHSEAILSKVDLMRYTAEQLPKELLLKKDVQVTDSSSGIKMTIPANSRVKLVRLETGMLVVGTGAPNIEGQVEVQDTDIREQIIANPPAAADAGAVAAAPGTAKPAPMDAMAKAEPEEAGTAEPTEKSTDPAETAAADPNMKADPSTDKPAEPAADPAASTAFAPIVADEIVKIMQDSIKAEQIKEVKFDQVTEWAGSEPETLDGKQYNVGVVAYKGQTFLGVKTSRAKAYINGGKVIRWIGAKSGMDLK